jgi:hypothetical protein
MIRFFPVVRLRRPLLLVMAALALSSVRPALASPDELVRKYPPGSITSVEQADAAVLEAQREREAVEARYVDAESACYGKFFASPCVNKAKEARRAALAEIKAIDVEAHAFKRRDRVAQRDKVLEEQRAREASEAPARAEQERLNAQKAAQKAADVAARQAADKQPSGRAPATPRPGSPVPHAEGRDRIAEHAARMEQARAQEAADAEKRAQSTADYERKRQEYLERQREVAEKKAERAQKERERAARPAATP